MSCRYSNYNGKCELWDKDGVIFEHIYNSCDNKGICLINEDDNPEYLCEDFEER